MQIYFDAIPVELVQGYLLRALPHGSYPIISDRVANKTRTEIKKHTVDRAVRHLKEKPELVILVECLLFLKENGHILPEYAEIFLSENIAILQV